MGKDGFIKDYRKELDSDIWLMPPIYHRVWQWIKYSVNHMEQKIPNKDGSFTIIKPGQRATSFRQIAKGVGYYERGVWKEPNVKTIKVTLEWLIRQHMISVLSNTNGTILTVENWNLYQIEESKSNAKKNTKVTLNGLPVKHSLDTNKNEKNDKEYITPYPLTEFSFGSDLENIILLWVRYKAEEKNDAYKTIGFKSLLKEIKKHSDQYGEQAVINLITKCMSNTWKGIIWEKIETTAPIDNQKQITAEKKKQIEDAAEAVLEKERRQMQGQKLESPANLNFNFLKEI